MSQVLCWVLPCMLSLWPWWPQLWEGTKSGWNQDSTMFKFKVTQQVTDLNPNPRRSASKTHSFSWCPSLKLSVIFSVWNVSLQPPLLRSQEGSETYSNTILQALLSRYWFEESPTWLISSIASRVLITLTEQYIGLAGPTVQVEWDRWRGQTCPSAFSQKQKVKGVMTKEKREESIPSAHGEQVATVRHVEKFRERSLWVVDPGSLSCSLTSVSSSPLVPTHDLSACCRVELLHLVYSWQTTFPKPKINSHCSQNRL